MSHFSRRNFVFLSSGAAIGNMVLPGLATAEEAHAEGFYFSHSGLVTGQPKPLKHKSIPGFLSAEQIAPHHTAHYGGALKGYTAADATIEASVKSGEKLDAAAYGALKRIINSKGNSVVLHEMYFDGLTPTTMEPAADVRSAIDARFGSVEKWAEDFIASAKEAAGWAMLVKHPVNGKLYNVVSDEHAMGILWMAVPLVVIDTYEHAFYIDYENRKAEYVEKFIEHIDWNAVNKRFA
ncbi:superoxide dismutase [Aeoliella mucimassa]|uniref:superoxide dismutase n=1 Tax=Aeoliella mucimassa TaxID=2527972 RepID=A0A518AS34_9BACT|nr:Fe-Mn family superoxide dismutase [Aeoliella mucimassa]QDU57539.1 Superoxide dismutase [Fe] [Aeoliella mucimassa]